MSAWKNDIKNVKEHGCKAESKNRAKDLSPAGYIVKKERCSPELNAVMCTSACKTG